MKKGILSVVFFMLFANVSAQASVKLQKGDRFLSLIEGAKAIAVEDGCPEGARCFAPSTNVTVELPLNGCLDRLGPVSYQEVIGRDGKVTLFVSAVNIANERSLVAMCSAMPKARVKLHVFGAHALEDIQIRSLKKGLQNSN